MASVSDSDSKEIDCGDCFDAYISTMNTLIAKTQCVKNLFSDLNNPEFVFVGSYMTYSEHNGKELYNYYQEEDKKTKKLKSTTDANLFEIVSLKLKKDIENVLKNSDSRYLAFLVGSIIAKDNVSHHIGFIYDRETFTLRVFDSGITSWGPLLAITVKKLVFNVINSVVEDYCIRNGIEKITPRFVETFSTKLCSWCVKSNANPQDVTRGNVYDELKSMIFSRESLHRESFCQSWSILLMMADIQKIIEGGDYDFNNPQMDYWDNEKCSLELCIRRFILWIVKRNENIFQQYASTQKPPIRPIPDFLNNLHKCFDEFIPGIEIPGENEIICDQNLRIMPFSIESGDSSLKKRKTPSK